jgi:MFS family permease
MIVFVQEMLKSVTLDLGLLIMFLGAGLLCGSLLYGRFGKSDNCFKSIYSSLLSGGLMLTAFAFILMQSPHFLTAAGLAFALGLVLAPVMTATNTLIHDISSKEMLGKVFSSVEVIMHFAFLLFMFLGSSLAEFKSIGRAGLLIAVGIMLALIGLIGYLPFRLNKVTTC